MLLDGADLGAMVASAERLRILVARSVIRHESREARTTISLGVTIAVAGDTAISLLARADEALYEAKRSGRNRVVAVPGLDAIASMPS